MGIGSDFDGIGLTNAPEGLNDVTGYPKLTLELLKRGFSDADVRKVLGENFLRFFEDVERCSRELQSAPPLTTKLASIAPAK